MSVCVCVCGEMASLIPAAASSPAGAPSRSKKRPASPGTGSGPAKKKKTTAPGGSQVTEGGPGGRRACAGASSPPPFRACSRRGGAGRPLPQAGSAGVASPPAGTVVSLCVPRQAAPGPAPCLASPAPLPLPPRPWKPPSSGEGLAAGCRWAGGGRCSPAPGWRFLSRRWTPEFQAFSYHFAVGVVCGDAF